MDWFKKNPFWSVVAIASLVAVIGGVVFWRWAAGRASDLEQDLAGTRSQVARLKSRGVFPSKENVEIFNQTNARLQEYLAPAEERMRQGQIPLENVGPLEFKRRLRLAIDTLTREAQRGVGQSTKLPEGFTFGFSQYVAATIPAPDSIPALMQEVAAVQEIVRMLYEASVEEIVSVRRWPVESFVSRPEVEAAGKAAVPAKGAPKAAAAPAAPAAAGGDLLPAIDVNPDWLTYRSVPMEFTFVTDAEKVRRFMNRLLDPSVTKPFYIIRAMRVVNRREAPPTLDLLKDQAKAASDSGKTLGMNFILGTERIAVTMRIDYVELKAQPAAAPPAAPAARGANRGEAK
ncbi:MAG TPA: Amuc_1100 family pilus-like protein [Verrucomicrobiae bacterium]|nr:Amuc_1100 family pilus-like protein [Verrucomicrobiae bacterium]